MNCPVCDAKLRAVDRMGVEIDICPECKGIWLDRGELEKVVELSLQGDAPSHEAQQRGPRRENVSCDDRREHRERDDHDGNDRRGSGRDIDPKTGRPKKRESLLSNIFDVFGGGD